jgi:hypothetical protein
MTRKPLIAASGVLALAVAIVGARPTPVLACSMDPRPGVRFPGMSSLIVVPTSRVVNAARNLPFHLATVSRLREDDEWLWRPGARWWWKNRLTRWLERLRDRPPYGQLATLERFGGPDSAQVAAAVSRGRRRVVIVKWDMDSMCRPALRTERAPSFIAGERLFLTATLRDSSGWVGGRPTFDVTPSHFVYSESRYGRGAPRWAAAPLTADEVMSVYEALPSYEALRLEPDPSPVMAPLRTWMRRNASLAARPPADRMIENANVYARVARELAPLRP